MGETMHSDPCRRPNQLFDRHTRTTSRPARALNKQDAKIGMLKIRKNHLGRTRSIRAVDDARTSFWNKWLAQRNAKDALEQVPNTVQMM